LADIFAWEKNYDKGISTLKTFLPLYPENREILVRIAKYSLWANDKKEAIRFADAVLKKDPSDKEANDIRYNALFIHSVEAYAGYSYLDINDNIDGQNGFLGLRYKPERGKSFYGQVDYLNRFDREEGRVMAGGAYPLSPIWGVSGEAAFSPDAEIYPIISGRCEGIYSGISSLVLYGGINGSHYQEADLYGLSIAAEYYFSGPFALFTRIGVSNTDFGEGDDSTDASFFIKLTWYATDHNSLFGYFAYGNEPYMNRTIDQIGKIEAKTYGVGARYFFYPNMGVAPRIEYQNRQRDTRYLETALELLYRW
ncbi:MAG: YaiO family outer membrane beta-barrel protein, partial [Thermodesulfobacteriota bacterium]